jgi:hypothetical protein
MSRNRFTCPPQKPSGQGTFSDNIVGLQLVTGGGLTQGTFDFTTELNEKTNRTFFTGVFSTPINLNGLGLESVEQARELFERNFKVYPNFDLSDVTNFTQFGSLSKRFSTSVEKIINHFPAAIESTKLGSDYTTGITANNITYFPLDDITRFDLNVSRLRNPFDIDFTKNSNRNFELREIQVSPLRNFNLSFRKYSLFLNDEEYPVLSFTPTDSLTKGVLQISVKGRPFGDEINTFQEITIRPNDLEINVVFNEVLDEVEQFLLNRNLTPIYTSVFKVPKEGNNGKYFIDNVALSWPLNGNWNLDIITPSFTNYLTRLNEVANDFDEYRTNIISRFLTTDAFKEFDTQDQKVEKVLQIYGRNFDEVKKFIDGMAYMNSVSYNLGNNIPSQLLKNLSQTLGWNSNISPVSETDFLSTLFGLKKSVNSQFEGVTSSKTPDELNFEYYRNLVLNSAYLFKSKGTRKAIEGILRMVGAPDALIEFNEYVYVADRRISIDEFDNQYAKISGGTYVSDVLVPDSGNVFSILGVQYTGYSTTTQIQDVDVIEDEFPIDDNGFPQKPLIDGEYFFQKGAGWFESTPQHRSPERVNLTNSVFTGSNPTFQTDLQPFTYGDQYIQRYSNFPFMDLGYNLRKTIDNNKSWSENNGGLRENLNGLNNTKYSVVDDRLVVNVKNVDLFLNPAQGLLYDVWEMSRRFNYPIPNDNFKETISVKTKNDVDITNINPKPQQQTFFEFLQSFWNNFINVRNRQFTSNGKTGGYPTLESIYWRYLESQENIGVENNNFIYQTMIDYVNGLGDYWIRLVEQMVPATTIWNTGVRYENSLFHRQKFVWRRQEGCRVIPSPCRPCELTDNIFRFDCPIQQVKCSKYPWTNQIQSFGGVLANVLNNYLQQNGYVLNDCITNTLTTQWYVELYVDNILVVDNIFYNGIGYNLSNLSFPTTPQWDSALVIALNDLKEFGYNYYFEGNELIVYNPTCTVSEEGVNFKLNVGINFNILCN